MFSVSFVETIGVRVCVSYKAWKLVKELAVRKSWLMEG